MIKPRVIKPGDKWSPCRYKTTDTFKEISEHYGVMKPDGTLIAVVGSTTDEGRELRETKAVVRAFSKVPELMDVLRKVEELTDKGHIKIDYDLRHRVEDLIHYIDRGGVLSR